MRHRPPRSAPHCITVETPRGRAAVPVEDAIRLYSTGRRTAGAWILPALFLAALAAAALAGGAL